MAYTQDQIEQKRRDADAIKDLCQRVPASHATWSYGRAVDFKTAASDALCCANNPKAKPESVRSALETLRGFYA